MRLTLRLLLSLILGAALVSFLAAFSQFGVEKRTLRNSFRSRAETLAESLQPAAESAFKTQSWGELDRILRDFSEKKRLAGTAVFDKDGRQLSASAGSAADLTGEARLVQTTLRENKESGDFLDRGGALWRVDVVPLHQQDSVVGALAILQDAAFFANESARMWRTTLLRALIYTLLIVSLMLVIIRWSIISPIRQTAQWMRDLRAGKNSHPDAPPHAGMFQPIAQEVSHLVKSLETARASAQEEARLREARESLWTAERLRAYVRGKLQGSPLFVVSNREPYSHVHRGRSVEVVVPASGLVTALEPILRACDGTWIAHGSGDADRETVDAHDRLRVPPNEPGYTLRRVWLGKEEEFGYYYGFANEGLWPLCHIAHTRPIFRAPDWRHYQEVNRKFAEVCLEEMKGTEQPLLLVQDYHFALLPRLVKEQRPDARVAIFWHIPWPNPEAFGICPWQKELLEGLLGADLVGFHIQAHCNNFLETVDMALESQIEWERFAVNRSGHRTFVQPFPISVDFVDAAHGAMARPSPFVQRAELLKNLGVHASFMGIGVDRVDYTKGILERFRGVERFFEKWPAYCGKFTFVQIGAPSRTQIKRYDDFLHEVEQEAARINSRFATNEWKPIVLLTRHHSHAEVLPYYQVADLCIVSSLHDGMNLVAKEFVASRNDDGGVLVLSCFTGAARELRDALIVNPYDTEELAEAIHAALELNSENTAPKMHAMRDFLREHNVYRWAGNLIGALADVRTEAPVAARE
ncbi:MAG: alpha,alpha-trehalose-phosphate synthase (UDP-forming) [Candidatus Acidiferrales bacterium]